MGIDALYLAIIGCNGIVGAATPAVANMLAALANPIHILLELAHPQAWRRACKVLPGWMITDVAHDVLRHAYKTIAWIDASIRAHGKGILHAVHECADGAPAGEYASAVVADISDLYTVKVLKVPIQQIDQQLAVLLGRERPSIRIVAAQRW